MRHDQRPSKREIEVLSLKACGMTNKEAAKELGISIHTVSLYARNSIERFGVRNAMAAVVVCIRDGYIDPEKLSIMRRYSDMQEAPDMEGSPS